MGVRGRVVLWDVLYWSSYVATWAVYPFMQAYVSSGEFTVLSRARAAIRVRWVSFLNALRAHADVRSLCVSYQTNLLWYALYLGAGAVGAVYVFATRGWSWTGLTGLAIALGNTWALLLAVLFMGVGLVLVPRMLWRSARPAVRLQHALARLPALQQQTDAAEEALVVLLSKVRAADTGTTRRDPVRPLLDQVLQSVRPHLCLCAARVR